MEKAMLVNKKNSGFSLVELVIVIVILGIIAAIAIPRISSGSKNAGEAALRANLQSVRNAIDWFYGDHNNTFPSSVGDGTNAANSSAAFITQLSQYSNAAGVVSVNKDPLFPFGPYLRSGIPNLSVGGNAGKGSVAAEITVVNAVTPITVLPGDGTGWHYNTQTGQFVANSTDAGNSGKTFDTY
jgi:prepilin-type N-terminal cleavage/methylation domain-containing protein